MEKLRHEVKKFGRGVVIGGSFEIYCTNNLSIGDDVSIGHNFYCACSTHGTVEIGENTAIASGVMITTTTHDMYKLPIRSVGIINKSVSIGKNVWIGLGAIILPGVNIGYGAMVAAGAVVTKDVETNHLVGGVPAKTMRVIDRKERNINE